MSAGVGSANDSLDDSYRVDYLSSYMGSTLDAIRLAIFSTRLHISPWMLETQKKKTKIKFGVPPP